MKSILKKAFYLLLFSATVLQLEAQENHIARPDFNSGNEHHSSVIHRAGITPNVRGIKDLNENSGSFDLGIDGRGDAKVVYQSNTLSKKVGVDVPLRDSVVYYQYTNETLLDSVRNEKFLYFYDSKNHLISKEDLLWNIENKSWDKRYNHIYKYDSRYNRILWEKYSWDSDNNHWKLIWDNVDVFDSNNNCISIETHGRNGSDEFIPFHRYEYSFDISNIELTGHRFDWNLDNQTWDSYYYFEFSYDSNGNRLGRDHYMLDDGKRSYYYKVVREYDSNHNEILVKNIWFRDNQWIQTGKHIYTYNYKGILSVEYYDLDEAKNIWIGDWKSIYTRGEFGELLYDSESSWDIDNGFWQISRSGLYYYEKSLLSNKENLFSNNYSLFPNPVSSNNTIMINTRNNEDFSYKIFTSNGKLVLQGTSSTRQKNIDVSSLEKGIYMLQIINKDGALSSKFIK